MDEEIILNNGADAEGEGGSKVVNKLQIVNSGGTTKKRGEHPEGHHCVDLHVFLRDVLAKYFNSAVGRGFIVVDLIPQVAEDRLKSPKHGIYSQENHAEEEKDDPEIAPRQDR